MSVYLYVACDTHKCCVWIGEECLSGFRFYRGEPERMELLHTFLREHILCSPIPRFAWEHDVDRDDGWQHIETSPKQGPE